ncbi:MAG TPA: hypothetical protein VFS10_18300 [Pyrinomonadaceae bacterium]|nr:hypothetical protein [Pyrinomonadaceae bacterium]
MKRLLLTVGVCLAAMLTGSDVSQTQTGNCPPCYSDRAPMTSDKQAHQLPPEPNCDCTTADCPGCTAASCPTCTNDNRLVVRVRFDTTPGLTWSSGPDSNGGQIIEPSIYHAVRCALSGWNTARGTNGGTVPYFFVIDQNASNAQIVIRREQPEVSDYASISSTPAPPYIMRLTPTMSDSGWTHTERCGTIKHELGHPLNAGNANGCTDPEYTIMSGYGLTGHRYTNTIHARDVDAAQHNAFNRATCTLNYLNDRGDEPNECSPMDFDEDGLTGCDGDCNDLNPFVTTGCQTGPGGTCSFQTIEDPWIDTNDCTICDDNVDNDCDGLTDSQEFVCWNRCLISPVLVDTQGDGFALTGAAEGVNFDLNSDGTPEHLSWTYAGSDDAWLALDRDGDGTIDDGRELFGNFTPQPQPPPGVIRNGFHALAVYDRPEGGGNDDGKISEEDAVFSSLRLWRDVNHNGVSEAGELSTLPQLGLSSIEVRYKESKRRDEHGNWFRFRAKVRDERGAQLGRWAWDVFLVSSR